MATKQPSPRLSAERIDTILRSVIIVDHQYMRGEHSLPLTVRVCLQVDIRRGIRSGLRSSNELPMTGVCWTCRR